MITNWERELRALLLAREKLEALERGPWAYFVYYCNRLFGEEILEGHVDFIRIAEDVHGELNHFVSEHREQFLLASLKEYLNNSQE